MSLVSWEKQAMTSLMGKSKKAVAQASDVIVERLPFTPETLKTLQEKAAKDMLPSVVAKMGEDALLLSSRDLLTSSHHRMTAGPLIKEGGEITVDGVKAAVLHADPGFTEIDASKVTVAILDSGMDVSHQAFEGRVVKPFNVFDKSENVADVLGHGTFVAGVVGGAAEGVAPSVKLMPVKITDDAGNMGPRQVAEGIYYAVDNGAQIINMSLGGPAPKTLGPEALAELAEFEKAVKYARDKNVLLVSVSGNDGRKNVKYFPSDFEGILNVGAVNRIAENGGNGINHRPFYSNYGDRLDLVAPGTAQAAIPGGGMKKSSGTSVAAPHVSGAAALVLAQNPTWTADQIADHLKRAVNDLGPKGKDPGFGYGQLNIQKAVYGTNLPEVPAAPRSKGVFGWLKERLGLG